jgi:hypothetical protein
MILGESGRPSLTLDDLFAVAAALIDPLNCASSH